MPQAKQFDINVIEGDDMFGPREAQLMDLPFNEGWESWAIVKNGAPVLVTPNFELAFSTYYTLNNIKVTYETEPQGT